MRSTQGEINLFHGRLLVGLTLLGLFIIADSPFGKVSSATEFKGVTFADSIVMEDHELSLRGAGTLKWKVFFTVYAAALYLPPDVQADDILRDVPKRIEFHYFVEIDGEQFPEAAEPYLEKNLTGETLARLRPKIDLINRLYRDVKEGDRYALTYTPGRGTNLALNGEELGTVEGKDFAAAYFTIWLGEKPISRRLKRSLLKSSNADEKRDNE